MEIKTLQDCSAEFTCYLGIELEATVSELCNPCDGVPYMLTLDVSENAKDFCRENGVDFSDAVELCKKHTGTRFQNLGSLNGYIENVLCEYPGDAPEFCENMFAELGVCY